MTDRRISQVILEVAETPSTNDRRISQVIAEVAETPSTNDRRISQVIAEVAYTPAAAPGVVAGVGAVPEVDPSFPTLTSTIVFRLHAPDVSGADGDPVSSWPDATGHGHTFTGSSTTRPLKKVNIAGPNSDKPGIQFDGSDDYLDGGDLQSVFPSAAAVFIVYQPSSSDQRWALVRNTGNDSWMDFDGDGYLGIWRTSRIGNYPGSGAVPNSGRHSYAVMSSSSTYQAFLDGTAKTAQTASYADGEAYFYVGGGAPSDPQGQNRAFTGYIFEVIALDAANSTDLGLLEVWAEAYWGFGSTARPSRVAGVGAVPAPTAFAPAGPLAVAGTGAVPAPTATGAATASPSAVVGIGLVPASTASGVATAAPATAVGIGAVPAPTAIGIAIASPAAVAGVGAVPASTAIGATAGQATPNVVTGTGAVPAPTATGTAGGFADPDRVIGIGAVPAPTATGTISGFADPDRVIGVGAVPASTATGTSGGFATPDRVVGIGGVPAPAAIGVAKAVPSVTLGTGAIPAATAVGQINGFVVPSTVVGIGRIYRPSFPSTTDPGGGGTGGSGGGGTSEITTRWRIELRDPDA